MKKIFHSSFRLLIFTLIGLNLVYFVIYLFQIPVFHKLRYWFWDYQYKDLRQWYWLFLDFSFIVFILYLVIKDKIKIKYLMLILIYFAGVFHQFSLGFSEGKGINGMSERMLRDGHSEFIRVAANYPDLEYTLSNYNDLALNGRLGLYPNSKPPGTLGFYIVLGKLTDCFCTSNSIKDKIINTANFSAIVLPFISGLVLFPLFFFAKRFLNDKLSALASILFITSPAISLIILVLDNVLFPLIFITLLLFNEKIILKPKFWTSFLLGCYIFLSLFFTFSLLPALMFILCVFAHKLISEIYLKNSKEFTNYLKSLFAISIGFAVANFMFAFFLNYQILERYSQAILFHSQWKHWVNTPKYIFYFSSLNFLDFGTGVGVSVFFMYLISILNISLNTIKDAIYIFKKKIHFRNLILNISKYEFYSFVLLFTFLFLGLFGKTKAETARLWLFLMTIICILVVNLIDNNFKEKSIRLITLLICLQLLTDYLLKFTQDFEYLR